MMMSSAKTTSSSSTRKPPANSSTAAKPTPPAESNLAALLRHFVGIDLIVETKQGRSFRGRLREADAYMNLVLQRTNAQAKASSQRAQQTKFISEDTVIADGAASEQFDWVHIRGPSIRYIVFGANVDITGIVRAGRDRERAAGDKYRRGVRKARK